jgi:hypothetical protein
MFLQRTQCLNYTVVSISTYRVATPTKRVLPTEHFHCAMPWQLQCCHNNKRKWNEFSFKGFWFLRIRYYYYYYYYYGYVNCAFYFSSDFNDCLSEFPLLHFKRFFATSNTQLTLNLLTTTIVAHISNASKWQVGSNSAFKGLIQEGI